ncbi:hypothetical protein ACFWY9_10320 [Amycolatopsis sp. NPDC059027]|uniref:hypothetical protein n=1 Tax=Amycolatopsis sp. NPDC059027 TaxID=3346709 RepID=UPI00366F0D3B
MDGPGFHVEIEVLESASKSMGQVAADQDGFALRGLCGEPPMYGHNAVDAAAALLDAGANIEARANRELTTLHIAVNRWRQSSDGALIKLLLERGADKTSTDMHGWTPLERSNGQFGFPDDLRELLVP